MSEDVKKSKKRTTMLIAIIITIIILILLLVRCGFNKNEEPEQINEPEKTTESTNNNISKGFVEVEDGTITKELKDLFDTAVSKIENTTYEPIKLIAIQETNDGKDYKFLAIETTETKGTKETNDTTDTIETTNNEFYVIVHETTTGTPTVINVEATEISNNNNQSTTITTTDTTTTPTRIIIFRDQYGNVIQRSTSNRFNGTLPEGFESWITIIDPVTGEINYKAKCHETIVEEKHTTGGGTSDTPSGPTHTKNEYGFYYDAIYRSTDCLVIPPNNDKFTIEAVFTDFKPDGSNRWAIIEIFENNNSNDGDLQFVSYQIDNSSPSDGCKLIFNVEVDDHPTNIITTVKENLVASINGFPDLNFNVVSFDSGIINDMAYKRTDLCKNVYNGNGDMIIPENYKIIREDFTKINNSSYGRNSKKLIMASSIEIIETEAFLDYNFEEISFPEDSHLKTIGDKAFSNTKISSLNIPSSVKNIEESAFLGCSNLSSLTLGSNLEKIGNFAFKKNDDQVPTDEYSSIIIPKSVIDIGNSAFSGWTHLTSVTFEEDSNVKIIGANAFNNSKLDQVIIPASVEVIGVPAFRIKETDTDIIVDAISDKTWRYCDAGVISEKVYNLNVEQDKNEFIKLLKETLNEQEFISSYFFVEGKNFNTETHELN